MYSPAYLFKSNCVHLTQGLLSHHRRMHGHGLQCHIRQTMGFALMFRIACIWRVYHVTPLTSLPTLLCSKLQLEKPVSLYSNNHTVIQSKLKFGINLDDYLHNDLCVFAPIAQNHMFAPSKSDKHLMFGTEGGSYICTVSI